MLEIFQFIAICLACFSLGFSLSNFLNQRIHRSADKIIDLQKAEIERLKKIVGFTPARGSGKSLFLNAVLDNVRAEAIKEFAERLKIEKRNLFCIENIDGLIDNLVKEMVGDV